MSEEFVSIRQLMNTLCLHDPSGCDPSRLGAWSVGLLVEENSKCVQGWSRGQGRQTTYASEVGIGKSQHGYGFSAEEPTARNHREATSFVIRACREQRGKVSHYV